jgi:hypothetical protein
MLDRPSGAHILAAVSRLLRETLALRLPADAVFQARVAASAIDLVAREITFGPNLEHENFNRLKSLLDRDGDAQDLERELSMRIRAGEMDLNNPELVEHLWETTFGKMKIDQPTYAGYQRELRSKVGRRIERRAKY